MSSAQAALSSELARVQNGLMLTIYLVRHGETEWSITGQHTGSSDITLTARGEDEARELRPTLERLAFTAVLTSPRRRALRTCELAGMSTVAEIDPDIAEWDYGMYEGKRSVDIRKQRHDWDIFRDGCPGGELPTQISARADKVIARLGALDGNVALFSHGEFGCVLATRWIGLPVLDAQYLSFGPATLSIPSYRPNHPHIRVIALWSAAPRLFASPTTPPPPAASDSVTLRPRRRAVRQHHAGPWN